MNTEELSIPSYDQVELKGTLSLPESPKSLLIPVHGSFLQTREGALDDSKKWMIPEGVPKRQLFRQIAEELYPNDTAVFRYDKRASGKSGGVYEDTDLTVLAKDLGAIFIHLRARFPKLPIGFVGQSEGGLVVLRANELGFNADFIVLSAAALAPFSVAFKFQKERAAAPFLKDESMIAKYPYFTAFFRDWNSGKLTRAMSETDDKYYELSIGEWSHRTNLQKYRDYEWDGVELLKKVDVPVLLLMGEEDGSVPPEPAKRVHADRETFGNVEVKFLKGLDHSFATVDSCGGVVASMANLAHPSYFESYREFIRSFLSQE